MTPVERLATVHLIEPDPHQGNQLMLYEVKIHITPSGLAELQEGLPQAYRTILTGCRALIAGYQARGARAA
jgi:hypothetical protein